MVVSFKKIVRNKFANNLKTVKMIDLDKYNQ